MTQVRNTIVILLALIFLQACGFTRTMLYWKPNISDHKIFHHVDITPGDSIFHFEQGNKDIIKKARTITSNKGITDSLPLVDYIANRTATTALLVIRNDSILFENYYRGYKRDSISTVFSVSKSITSLLTGIAVDEGYIESVHDPVTKYVPELKKKDPRFERLTIEHLLNMRAGFEFNENNLRPLSRPTRLYYGLNHLGKVAGVDFRYEPGEVHEYQSLVTALLGVVVERAIGRNLGEYLQEKVWVPMGMENRATWSIDDKKHYSAKAHVGVNATAIDLAKIGRLYMNKGNWNGKQIVSADWVAKSTTPNIDNDAYQYQWYSYGDLVPNPEKNAVLHGFSYFPDSLSARNYVDKYLTDSLHVEIETIPSIDPYCTLTVYRNENSQFAAEGIMHQWIFVDPEKKVIVVRLGEKEDVYSSLIQGIIGVL